MSRDDFSEPIKITLAKRSGFLCSICKAHTIASSNQSESAIINIGVAAHITGAAPKGPRYDKDLTSENRSSISNGIWLCQNHAKMIDCDTETWTKNKLHEIKHDHEKYVREKLGIPLITNLHSTKTITPRESAFVVVDFLDESYKKFISPILEDKQLSDNTELGILMCGSSLEDNLQNYETRWTIFVNADWLRWFLIAQENGYGTLEEVPKEQIYGRIPEWPDSFLEFIEAIVQSNTTFHWQRHNSEYLILSQYVE